jgi:hypothetical protein
MIVDEPSLSVRPPGLRSCHTLPQLSHRWIRCQARGRGRAVPSAHALPIRGLRKERTVARVSQFNLRMTKELRCFEERRGPARNETRDARSL